MDKKRKAKFGEVFTPPELVEQTLDLLDPVVWSDPKIVFVEAACGEGAFVVAIVRRRFRALGGTLEALLTALNTIWGWDIQADNVHKCQLNLLDFVSTITHDRALLQQAATIIKKQISQQDSLKAGFQPPRVES